MAKAFFTRKAVNVDELKSRTGEERDKSELVIEKIIELPTDQWEHFKENLLDDFDFIEANVEFQYIDTDRVWHCIGIMEEGGNDIVCGNCESFSYLRYSTYFPDAAELIAEHKKYIMSDKVIEQVLVIRAEAKFNMFSAADIQREAFEKGFNELVVFLDKHKKEYSKFVLTGER